VYLALPIEPISRRVGWKTRGQVSATCEEKGGYRPMPQLSDLWLLTSGFFKGDQMPKAKHENESERRKHQRYAANIQVEITADCGKATGVMVGTSLEGLRIWTNTLIEPATDVVITFSTGEKVILLAGVAWVLDKIDGGLPLYSAGLKINSVSVSGKELLGMAERTAFLQDLIA
jgi:hypothetical protein